MSSLAAFWNELKASYSSLPQWTEALTHKSFSPDGGHYEKWELLGDAVLDLAIIDLLLQRYPDLSEGELSKRRAALVNQSYLAQLARQLGLEADIRLGRSELKDQGVQKDRILASVLEALLGVVYKNQDWPGVLSVVERLFAAGLANKDLSLGDYKTELQEWTQKWYKATPQYELVAESSSTMTSSSRTPYFWVQVRVQGQVIAQGEGTSRKQAEQQAARRALEVLRAQQVSQKE